MTGPVALNPRIRHVDLMTRMRKRMWNWGPIILLKVVPSMTRDFPLGSTS